jgi:hypothetical protein
MKPGIAFVESGHDRMCHLRDRDLVIICGMTATTESSPEHLLREWQSRAELALFAYNRAASRCRSWDTRLGGLIAVLSAIVGTSVFATLQNDVSVGAKIAVGMISVVAAVVAGVQAFATLSKRAYEYERAARVFGSLRREIEEARSLLRNDPNMMAARVLELRLMLDDAAKDSPNAPPRIWNRARREMKGEFTGTEHLVRWARGLPPPSTLGSGEPEVGEG